MVERSEAAAQGEEAEDRADGQRAPQICHSTGGDEDYVADGLGRSRLGGADAAAVVGHEAARRRGDHGAENKGLELEGAGVDAHGVGGEFAVVERPQGAADARVDHVDEQEQDGEGQPPRKVVVPDAQSLLR